MTALWERGTSGVHVQPGPAGTVLLVAYFPTARSGRGPSLQSFACGVPNSSRPPFPMSIGWPVSAKDSAPSTRRVQIVPSWEPVQGGLATGRTLRILPGRAFGTGTHETTRLCLMALQWVAARRPLGRVVDVGSGTGILAVAAALLGARPVTATDIDPEAIESAGLHARMNAVDLHLVRGDGGRSWPAAAST